MALLRVVLDWDELAFECAGETISEPRLLVAHALESAQFQQLRALADLAPRGCGVSAVLPKISGEALRAFKTALPQLNDWQVLSLRRRDLIRAFRLGMSAGVPAGMIHSDSLFAPLLRHERSTGQQTVVTVADLSYLDTKNNDKNSAWQRALLKRAAKFADAVVVPSHAWVEPLEEFLGSADRVRVIPPATAAGFAVPSDARERLATLGIRDEYLLLSSDSLSEYLLHRDEFLAQAQRLGLRVVVLAQRPAEHPDAANELFLANLSMFDRAAVIAGASLFYSISGEQRYPLEALSALKLGIRPLGLDNAVSRDVFDGAALLKPSVSELVDAMELTLEEQSDPRLQTQFRIRSLDRDRTFSWESSAERIWHLHADL